MEAVPHGDDAGAGAAFVLAGAAQACRITQTRRMSERENVETVYALSSIPRGPWGWRYRTWHD